VASVRKTAGGVLYGDGRVLLALRRADRAYYPGVWDIVSGHARDSENPADTLDRELREELGVVPVHCREIGVFPEPNPERCGPGRHYLFVVTQWHGVPRNLRRDEHESIGWFSRHQLSEIDLACSEYVRILKGMFATSGP
jgi:8-oxo-dGTP pyrophosphatase MutT (NUDIX family)